MRATLNMRESAIFEPTKCLNHIVMFNMTDGMT